MELLIKNKSGQYFDGTVGFGGHSFEILKNINQNAVLIGTDKDKDAFDFTNNRFSSDSRFFIYNTSFINIDIISKLESVAAFDGILVDLGVSSFQLDDVNSGFTYREDSILDLRMNKSEGQPAFVHLNSLSEEELSRIFFEYGEEKFSRRIARNISEFRENNQIKTSFQLKEIIKSSVGIKNLNKSLSRVFQAIRIYVNNELEELKIFLGKAIEYLKPGGRIAVISFHSLEDRIVKEFIKYESLECICPPKVPVCTCGKIKRLNAVTKKPLIASDEEIRSNPRARSAKLRVAEKI